MENQSDKEVLKSLEERVSLLERVVGRLAQQREGHVATPTPSPVAPPVYTPPQPVAVSASKTSTEIEVGQKWLSVVGVILIFLAALFFVQFVFKYIGPVGKVGLSYLGAAILFAVAFFTKKKYEMFSSVVTAGAWGVTYIVTYALHFFPATRLITSAPFEMVLLTAVVMLLFVIALYQRSKPLISVGLVLGVLTMMLSPLSLFSIVGTVVLLGVLVAIAVILPWGDFMLPATLGAYISYVFWFNNVLDRLPAQGGGLLEKQLVGLIALILMMVTVAIGVVSRKDEEKSVGGDALTVILSFAGTGILGLFTIRELVLAAADLRLAQAIWLLVIGVLIGGWAIVAYQFREKKDPITAGSVIALIMIMSGVAYLLPSESSGTSLAWAAMGLVLVIAGLFRRNVWLGAFSTIPFVASAVRFIAVDMQHAPILLTPDFSLNILIGFVLAIVIMGSAALLRTLDWTSEKDKEADRLPGILLGVGLLVLYLMTAQEFSGALPSIVWGVAGLLAILGGFVGRWKDARIAGLIGLAITVLRVFVYDLGNLDALARVISFAILGGLLLLVAYGYNHNKEKLQKYLLED